MASRIEWSGLEEFKAFLRQLPDELRDDSSGIVVDAATRAKTEVEESYPPETPDTSGNLKRGVRLEVLKTIGGTIAFLKSTARHAHLYEFGTRPRYFDGLFRGAMPAARKTFIGIVTRHRREMYQRLADMLREKGFQVSGDGGNG